jgi:osmotically-inducible protein OsmY
MSTRDRRDYGRRSENYERRGNQEGYGVSRGDQGYHRPAYDNDSEQGEEARTLDSARDEDFAEEGYFEGESYSGRRSRDEERYRGQGHGSGRYSNSGQQSGDGRGYQGAASGGGRQGHSRRYGDRRDESYGAVRGDQGYGPDPREGVELGGSGLGGYIQRSGRGPFSQEGAYESRLRSGGFRGKGPKGYQRSDERIAEEVNQVLADDDDLDASDIEVSVAGGEVTLTGTVSDRQAKRWAEDLVEGVSGVVEVQNHVRVKREQQSAPSTPRTDAAREGGRKTRSKAEG